LVAGLALACTLVGAYLLPGCGSSATTQPFPATSVGTDPSQQHSTQGWEVPTSEVLTAFHVGSVGLSCPLYVPALLPAGTRPVTDDVGSVVGGDVGAELAVALTVNGGTIQVWEGVAADVGDASGEPCGAVDGRPAIAYPMLGGVLVQWSDRGWWYGVFSRDVPKDAVVAVATSMVAAADMEP
jgi:hypothetical protein